MEEILKPGLFGLKNSNRDFTSPNSWGKNQFNSSFPASLVCYMGEKNISPVHLILGDDLNVQRSYINADVLLGLPHNSDSLLFSFEDSYTPYADLVLGQLSRADLITRNRSTEDNVCLAAFEIKLTALPDSSTFDTEDESLYGCEIVVRPDTIVYIALSVAQLYESRRDELAAIISPVSSAVTNWEDANAVRPLIQDFSMALAAILKNNLLKQIPLMLQPIWKTLGRKGALADDCYDVFVWNNFSLMRLIVDQSKEHGGNFTRPERSLVWLVKMLYDFSLHGKINSGQVIDHLTYNTKNDKAFAINGKSSLPYMQSPELLKPRISKYATKEIILGGGQNYLSPERRLDSIILNSPGLFE